jgi:MYXO-CTERM domain-containing protein
VGRAARTLLWGAALLASGPALAAPGDTCAEAIDIAALPFLASASTCGASSEFTNSGVCTDLPGSYGGEDVVYKLTLGAGNRLGFELTMPPGATGDLALFLVQQPSCANPVCAGSSVDLIGAGVGPERIKERSYPAGTYYLIVDSALSAPDPAQCGGYALAVTGHLSEFCGNGIVEAGELCDDGNNLNGDCCTADCQLRAVAGTSCRPAAGPCDQAEVCDGSDRCPADLFLGAASMCRAAIGTCDLPETCAGTGPLCPADKIAPNGTLCRGSVGACDLADVCSGASGLCPADQFQPTGTVCALPTACKQAARCSGTNACPAALPTSCDDGNPCTQDTCDLVNGCLHRPICQDAGTDGPPDAGADASSPDAAADAAPPADAAPVPDAPVTPPDAAPRDAAVDAPAGTDARPDGMASLVPDARVIDEPMATNPQSFPDGSSPTPIDAGAGGAGGPDAGLGATPDSGLARDGSVITAEAGARTDGGLPINKLDGGCSCRLNASSSQSVSGLWGLLAVALVGRLARRRRPRV